MISFELEHSGHRESALLRSVTSADMHLASTSVGFVIFFIVVLIKICVIWKVLSYEPPPPHTF